jgi:hypothetical protein
MKRKREEFEKGRSEIMVAMEEISLVYDRKDRANNNSTPVFLSVSKQLLRILGEYFLGINLSLFPSPC